MLLWSLNLIIKIKSGIFHKNFSPHLVYFKISMKHEASIFDFCYNEVSENNQYI